MTLATGAGAEADDAVESRRLAGVRGDDGAHSSGRHAALDGDDVVTPGGGGPTLAWPAHVTRRGVTAFAGVDRRRPRDLDVRPQEMSPMRPPRPPSSTPTLQRGLVACMCAVVGLSANAAHATEAAGSLQLRTFVTDPAHIPQADVPRVLGGQVSAGSLGAHGTLQQGLGGGRSKSLRHTMMPVKDQGRRGTCSAFATIAIFEAMFRDIFSEQCLSKVGTQDASTLYEQFDRVFHGALYTERACPYNENNRDAVPANWRPRGNRVRGFGLSGDRFVLGDGKDIVTSVRRNLDNGMLIAAGVHLVGDWWRDPASVPEQVPVGPQRNVRIGAYGDYLDVPIRAKAPLVPYQIANLSPLRDYFARDPDLRFRNALVDIPQKPGQRQVRTIYRDFDDFVRGVRPLDVPSEEEITRECGDLGTDDSGRCGRHAIVITGYDDSAGVVEFRNSWGMDWKQSGYGYMTYAYLRRFHAHGPDDSIMVSVLREEGGLR